MTPIFIVLSWVNLNPQLLSQKKVTNKYLERRPEDEEVSTELLKVWIHKYVTLVHLANSSLVGEFTKSNVGFPLLRFVRAVRLGVFVHTRVPQHRVRQ